MSETLAVIFDMDGVLVDSFRPHYKSWLEMARRAGLSFTETEFAETFGRTSREIIAHFWGENNRFTDEEIAALDAEKEAAYRRIIDVDFPAMPGVLELLDSLKKAGYKLAVGTSGPPENAKMAMDKLDAWKIFDTVCTGADVEFGKPDPGVFLLAAKRLGVPASLCAVVEDAPPGIQAAHAAGMVCVGFASTGRTLQEIAPAEMHIHALCEITPAKIEKLIRTRKAS